MRLTGISTNLETVEGVAGITLSEELRENILKRGASIVGFADLATVPEHVRNGFRYGVIIGIALTPEVILGIKNGPTAEYYDEYKRINSSLDELDDFAAAFLKEKGYEALPKTRSEVKVDENTRRTELPYKTIATRAGIGWIGKSALLLTEEYGSAVRISGVLTNAVLDVGKPVDNSKCGNCLICKNICPAAAVSGIEWNLEKDRDEFYNAFECRKTAILRSGKVGIKESLCGLCIFGCPRTKKYLKRFIKSDVGGLELLPLVKPLWEGLREHHGNVSENFSESIRMRPFEDRAEDFLKKEHNHKFRIELIQYGDDTVPVGYSVSSLSESHLGEIESIYIEERYRGLDIGDLLMKNALEWMDSNNAKSKRISVIAGNDVLGFYEKYGFKVRSLILEQVDF
jgi:epoxyqueuosine reductase